MPKQLLIYLLAFWGKKKDSSFISYLWGHKVRGVVAMTQSLCIRVLYTP